MEGWDGADTLGGSMNASVRGPSEEVDKGAFEQGEEIARAHRWVMEVALKEQENFSVLSRVLPKELRGDFAAVYAFCRIADDLADEREKGEEGTQKGKERALKLLKEFRSELHGVKGQGAGGTGGEGGEGGKWKELFIALHDTISRHRLPLSLFDALLDAFEQDQKMDRYETWDELIRYSERSANPVGRIVLIMMGYRPPMEVASNAELFRASDAICTALQLTNFWQDVQRDLVERDRVYLPRGLTGLTAETLRAWMQEGSESQRKAYVVALKPLVARTWHLFRIGEGLFPLLRKDVRSVVSLFAAGGHATLRKIERQGYLTLWERPRLNKIEKGMLVAKEALGLSARRAASWHDE